MIAIEIEGLKKTYKSPFLRREVEGLRGLDLSVHSNEIYGFLGPNGAGKSTTIKILTGIIHPTAGTARILGVSAWSVGAREQLGYMPEFPTFHDFLRTEEFLGFFGALHGIQGEALGKRIEEVLEWVGLPGVMGQPLKTFSKGMLRRDVRRLMEHLRTQGKTVMFSSHVLSDVEEVADRICVLRQGQKVLEGRVDELLADAKVERLEDLFFLGEEAP
jgi:ABC-2 type transport system ATP-binding protein